MTSKNTGTVWFIGAGPGDPELLTIKAQKRIASAALVLYAGSLVPHSCITAHAHPQARIVDSAPLTLEECHSIMRETTLAGQDVARVHTGDPSLYGTIREQIRLLEADGIPYAIIPGVTSACAAAAAAGISFTVPDVTQTLIITRLAGRTPVPEAEQLRYLAAHQCSMAIYLSTADAENLQAELCQSLPAHTPVLCAHHLGWAEEQIVWTRLDSLAACVHTHGFTRQTIFLVLPGQDAPATCSRLYAADFSHGWRKLPTNQG